jgi:hypothetical protein
MASYGKKSNLGPSKVIDEAVKYFTEEWSLKVVQRTQDMVCLESDLGHVTITVCKNEETDVELETREFDYAVKEFMSKI